MTIENVFHISITADIMKLNFNALFKNEWPLL